MIIVIGASWACGEWKAPGSVEQPSIVHRGLIQYVEDSGRSVVDLTHAGMSNSRIVQQLKLWFDQNSGVKPDDIIVFQSDYSAEKHHAPDSDYDLIDDPYSLSRLWLDRFYQQLSDVAQKNHCTITLIGGGVDTLWFDDWESRYPGLKIGCQSMVNLILTGNHRIAVPVFSWCTQHSEDLVERIKAQMLTGQMPALLDMITNGHNRENTVHAAREYFWPDGCHPNRLGHRMLYDFLVSAGHL